MAFAAFFRCRCLRWRLSEGQSGPSGQEATDFAVDECGLRAAARNRSTLLAPGSSTRADFSWAWQGGETRTRSVRYRELTHKLRA